MTDKERKELADEVAVAVSAQAAKVAERLAAALSERDASAHAAAAPIPAAHCKIGLTVEDAATLREFAASLRAAKATSWAVLIKVLILGALGMCAAGFWEWAKRKS